MKDLEKNPSADYLGRPLAVGDNVFYDGKIYQIVQFSKSGNFCRIDIVGSVYPTKPVVRKCKELCVVPQEDVIVWRLKNE